MKFFLAQFLFHLAYHSLNSLFSSLRMASSASMEIISDESNFWWDQNSLVLLEDQMICWSAVDSYPNFGIHCMSKDQNSIFNMFFKRHVLCLEMTDHCLWDHWVWCLLYAQMIHRTMLSNKKTRKKTKKKTFLRKWSSKRTWLCEKVANVQRNILKEVLGSWRATAPDHLKSLVSWKQNIKKFRVAQDLHSTVNQLNFSQFSKDMLTFLQERHIKRTLQTEIQQSCWYNSTFITSLSTQQAGSEGFAQSHHHQ